jgi:hypothetical protein
VGAGRLNLNLEVFGYVLIAVVQIEDHGEYAFARRFFIAFPIALYVPPTMQPVIV